MTARGRRLARLLNSLTRMPGSRPFTRLHALVYVLSRGRVARRWFGSPVLVLETTGRRSGKRRRRPLIYTLDGDTPVVLAANAGHPRMPIWFLNLQAAGHGVVYLGRDRRAVVPRLLDGDERDRLWEQLALEAPSVEHYPKFADRPFPLVALEAVVESGTREVSARRSAEEQAAS